MQVVIQPVWGGAEVLVSPKFMVRPTLPACALERV